MVTRVKIPSAVPGDAPKPVNEAVIDGQGKIPYKGERESFAEAPMDVPDGVARGMGAAKRGGNYKGIK